MDTPESFAEFSRRAAAADWPAFVTAEWCATHRLIEQLTCIQRRMGTPLEKPEDFLELRELGTGIREKLDQLSPWLSSDLAAAGGKT
jgi:hypothetical protein